ncbi:MAG: hypothetical protein LBL99_04105 [Holosporaceae bacterium]|jgi:hypothetical protein|nr:hypothetical protein [Holosporaceae bacterium]
MKKKLLASAIVAASFSGFSLFFCHACDQHAYTARDPQIFTRLAIDCKLPIDFKTLSARQQSDLIIAVRQIIGEARSATGLHGFRNFTGLTTSFGFEIISGHTRTLHTAEEHAEVLFLLLNAETARKLQMTQIQINWSDALKRAGIWN